MAVNTGRKHGRARALNTAFTASVHDRVYARVHVRSWRLRTVYTEVHEPCTRSVHDPKTAEYTAVSRPVYGRVRSSTRAVNGRVHSSERPVYTALYRVHGCL